MDGFISEWFMGVVYILGALLTLFVLMLTVVVAYAFAERILDKFTHDSDPHVAVKVALTALLLVICATVPVLVAQVVNRLFTGQ